MGGGGSVVGGGEMSIVVMMGWWWHCLWTCPGCMISVLILIDVGRLVITLSIVDGVELGR